jgi:aryl-alcohol dehydrogenase-like predicted oxidoreductase
MRYRTLGTDPGTRREVSVLCLGAMLLGTVTDEATSMAILDRYAEAGGTFIDTANNYAFWVNGTQGGESENLLGRWRRSRGVGDEIVIATKLGGRPNAPARARSRDIEGLSAKVIRESAERSRERLGVERLDLLYAHVEDPVVPLSETVEAFGELVAEGAVGLLGASNHWAWRVERARTLAAAAGLPGYEVLQYHHSYLRQRTDLPTLRSPDGDLGVAGGDLLSYVRAEGLPLVAYSPLLGGAYVRQDKPLGVEFDHAGTPARLAVLREVAAEAGATVNQVVLAWLIGGDVPMIPLVGASSVAQLEESLAAVDLSLTAAQRARLDAAPGQGDG